MGNLLIIAFHFPPQAGSSGQLRSLRYCRYLPEFGWQPAVLAPNLTAYETIDAKSIEAIPRNVPVIRSFALDTKKHLGIGGRYLRYLALPDRWVSWTVGGVLSGLRAVREHKIDILYSTFPIMSAAVIGLILHRLTKLPWVLDLRDPMTNTDYPHDALVWRVWRSIERKCMSRVSRVIFTTESTRKRYLERYPDLLKPEKCILISNGYDEEDFRGFPDSTVGPVPVGRPIRLVHSGLLYPLERDPRPMFSALAHLKQNGHLNATELQIVFRAPGREDLYAQLLADDHIEDLVVLAPHVPYQQALKECADADGLLLFQAANFDLQIPAKAYEYLRLGKPIFALTTSTGDTAALLREVGGATIVNLASEYDIYEKLPAFVQALRDGNHPLPNKDRIRSYTRQAQAGQLAKVLDGVEAHARDAESEKTRSAAG